MQTRPIKRLIRLMLLLTLFVSVWFFAHWTVALALTWAFVHIEIHTFNIGENKHKIKESKSTEFTLFKRIKRLNKRLEKYDHETEQSEENP